MDPPGKKGKALKWGLKWHGRLVFQYERPNTIIHVARRLAADEEVSDEELRELLDEGDDVVTEDADSFLHSHDDDERTASARRTFTKYQTAVSTLWNVLTGDEQERYHSDAEAYRNKGVPKEMRRK